MQTSHHGTNINFFRVPFFLHTRNPFFPSNGKGRTLLVEETPSVTITDLGAVLSGLRTPAETRPALPQGVPRPEVGRAGSRAGRKSRVIPGLTESKDSRSFSTKFSGGRIPRAGRLMNVLCKAAGGPTVTSGAPASWLPTSPVFLGLCCWDEGRRHLHGDPLGSPWASRRSVRVLAVRWHHSYTRCSCWGKLGEGYGDLFLLVFATSCEAII